MWPLITLRQVHSDIIHRIDSVPDKKNDEPLPGDGMITEIPGLLLAIQTADCLPVIVVDAKRHVGWSISRRLAWHGKAHRRKGYWRDGALLSVPPTGYESRNRSGHSGLLL